MADARRFGFAGEAADLRRPEAEREAWIVHAACAAEFVRAAAGRPLHAVLWTPSSGAATVPEDWWEHFHTVLREGDPADEIALRRFSRCPQIFEVAEAVEELGLEWFLGLEGSPQDVPPSRLPPPFSTRYRAVLESSPECREELYERLQARAEEVWQEWLPSPEEVADWLMGRTGAPALEELASRCPLVRALIEEQGRTWADAGLLDLDRLREKWASVHVRPIPGRVFEVRAPALVAAAAKSLAEWAAALADCLVGLARMIPEAAFVSGPRVATRSGPESRDPATAAGAFLRSHRSLRLQAPDQGGEVTLQIEPDGTVVLRVRREGDLGSPPRLRFLRGADVVGETAGEPGGAIRVTSQSLAAAVRDGFTGVEITF